MLPCLHLLCQSCSEGAGAKRNHCPFHKEPFQEEDVVWSAFTRDSILGRKVRCWNAEHGCDAEVVASAMLEHFANACQFHVVRCPECSESVRHRDIAEHLARDCEPPRARDQASEDNFSNAFMEVKGTLAKYWKKMLPCARRWIRSRTVCTLIPVAPLQRSRTSIADAVTAALERKSSELTTGAEAALAEDQREVISRGQGRAALRPADHEREEQRGV
ncbi:hypothetical protein V5799_020379 [Amblyomma americanum]|uniref:Uncharacterized protein n=1 Tax=Amblyomma americanum TaxID=6943 RepID=A0AAQ4EU82_AMBAM